MQKQTVREMSDAMQSIATLEQVLETAAKLPYEQQEMLIEILKRRRSENRRAEIADDAKQARADFRAGLLKPLSADEVIAELNQFLSELE